MQRAPNSAAAARVRRAQPSGLNPAFDRSASTSARSPIRPATMIPQAFPPVVVVGSMATMTLS